MTLRKTAKAKLIYDPATDKASWISNSQMRDDGSLTPTGITAIENGQSFDEIASSQTISMLKDVIRNDYAEINRQTSRLEGSVRVIIKFAPDENENRMISIDDKTANFWVGEIWDDDIYNPGQKRWRHLPLSQIRTFSFEKYNIFVVPVWLLDENPWLQPFVIYDPRPRK